MDGSMGSRCRVEGRRFSGNSGCEAERLFEERVSLRNRPLRGVSLSEEKTSRREQRGRGDLGGREFGAVTEPVRMVSGCGRPLHRGGSARKEFWTPIRSPAASASPGRTGGRGRSAPNRPSGSIRSGPMPRGTFAAEAGSIRSGLAHRMRSRGNPCPQPRSLDRSAVFGKCPNTPK